MGAKNVVLTAILFDDSNIFAVWIGPTHSMNNSREPQDRSIPQVLSSTVHAWVATAVFALITPHRTSMDDSRKPQLKDIYNINICPTKPIQVFNLCGFLCKFSLSPSNAILKID